MHNASLQFKIKQLRQDRLISALEAIAVFVFSLFAILFLPRLLFTYYYANMQLTEEPAVLTHMPLFFFVVGVGFFAIAMISNILRAVKIAQLEKQLASMPADACCMDCTDCVCDDHGNCVCGCDDKGAMTPATSGSTQMMAAKMSSLNKKKKSGGKRK